MAKNLKAAKTPVMQKSPKKTYWQSLEDLAPEELDKGPAASGSSREPLKTESLKREFPSPPLSMAEAGSGASRREFLQLMGAGMALASAGCMRRPAEKIVPYAKRPPDVIPGEASFYASSFYDSGEGFAALIKTREGRPIKIEGNPEAAMLNGRGLSVRAHAHILSLYDPERIKNPRQNLFNREKSSRETINISWEALDKILPQEFQNGRTALLTPRIPSPSAQKLIGEFKQAFSARHYVWDPVSFEDLSEAQKISHGQAIVPSYNFSRARVIFALNCDFLGTWLSPADFQSQFAKTRRPGPEMSRLIALETLMTLTGANADERHRLAHKDQLSALMALALALERAGHIRLPPEISPLIKSYEPLAARLPFPKSRLSEWADQLGKNRGRGLIVYGELGGQTDEARAIHVIVNFLNSALGNDGITVSRRQAQAHKFGSFRDIKSLIEALSAGDIQNLIIYKVNPVYSYPDHKKLLSALKKAKTVVYAGDRIDETGFHADYIAPDSHDLEKWGDWEFKKGVFSIQQPAIRPLYKTRAFEDSLLAWIKGGQEQMAGRPIKQAENYYRYIKSRWESEKGPGFWNRFLEKGVWGAESPKTSSPARAFRPEAAAFLARALKKNLEGFVEEARLKAKAGAPQNPQEFQKGRESGANPNSPKAQFPYHLSLYQTAALKGGDMSNVAWLQEFPDPVTKICWDNYLCISPKAAIKEGLREGDLVQVRLAGGAALKAPAHIQPGQEDSALALAVGYGRTRAGSVGSHVGVNAWRLAGAGRPGQAAFAGLSAALKKTGGSVPLANVQGHHSMEGRDIVLEAPLEEFAKNPSAGIPKHHRGPSLWSKHKYSGHKWGMAIDLNSCIGCGACMLACQSENNIPSVGKRYVLEGREMHWIRVDRYYKGGPDNPSALHQPVTCMHCDNAPCETVCPVLATVHSSEGTNDMIYNRCVGTRYCANNCPYKVRRFNWFGYDKKIRAPLDMALNPEVTVRGRGVMEKCTFCIQRIEGGKARAKREGRPLKDGEIQTACQQSCPSEAIVFGDLNDPGSAVAKAFQAKNSYALLDDMLNTRPAVKYRTKIRNKPAGQDSSNGAKPKASGH